jgi:Protein of unknown function (DUF4242)
MSFAARAHARTCRSRRQVEEMPDRVRWIRSYVVKEPDGRIGTFCIYQAQDPGSIREHVRRVGTPGNQILPFVKTVVIRDDPAEASVAA